MSNIAVNEKAPDFSLTNYNGDSFKLSNLKEESNVFIVLNRGFM
ncbi:MAG: hypothetical protein ACQEQE_05795 [Bacillota bacterium]